MKAASGQRIRIMDITRSKCCHRLSFVNLASCPHCGKAFSPGMLQSQARAEHKAFNKQVYAVFLAAFVVLAVVSIFLLAQQQTKPPAASHLERVLSDYDEIA